jgi:hypothetical protein
VKRIATACAVAGLLGLAGCADEQEALIVLGAALWSQEEDGCSADASSDEFLSHGQLDLYCAIEGRRCFGVSTSYQLAAVLQSQLTAGSNNQGVDTSEVQLRSVEVSYDINELGDLTDPRLGTFSAPLATDSIPGGATRIAGVEVVNETQAQALYESIVGLNGSFAEVTLLATLVFHASRTGNATNGVGDIEVRSYSFPIKLCDGCLRTCTTCEAEEGGVAGVCPEANPDELGWTGGLCGNSQDAPLTPTICPPLQ